MDRSADESNGTANHSEVVKWEFRGDSSGADLLQHIRDHVVDVLSDYNTSISTDSTPDMSSSNFSPILFDQSPNKSCSLGDLPLFETAKAVCVAAFSEMKAYYCFIHFPTFYQMLSEVYTLPSDNLMDGKSQYLNLLFSVLALGYNSERKGYNKRNRSGGLISETRADNG